MQIPASSSIIGWDRLARLKWPSTASSALARAQDFVRSEPATAHPFHWAGFVVVGDGTDAVELKGLEADAPRLNRALECRKIRNTFAVKQLPWRRAIADQVKLYFSQDK